jgi:hypothetical protein
MLGVFGRYCKEKGVELNASADRQMNRAVSAGDPESRPGENWARVR